MPMIPQGQGGPEGLAAMLAGQMGGGQAPPPQGGGDWLANAINSVHEGMVQESDAEQVSLLGAIINQLTTFQAKRMKPAGQGSAGG
jgi:hypothetical protein